MEGLSRHPQIKWNIHASGMLWKYLKENHKDYIKQVKDLVSNGRLEVLSGGYYEPIISQIPDRDKSGQIKKLTDFLKNEFKCDRVDGIWLAERVWEPGMAKIICENGIKFTILDDAHFAAIGIDVEKLNGYYTAEEQGFKLHIFPISQKMRYFIPFKNVEDTIEYFKHLVKKNPNSDTVITMADDGEKFGMWPSTYKHVYEDGWLERFLTALEQNQDIVETVNFSEILRTTSSSGRVYLPCSSYFEMAEWALPADEQQTFENVLGKYGGDNEAKRFLRGGFWRNFLTKYEESNNMHKKMIYVSGKIGELSKNEKTFSQDALDNLYAGQCNCAYWHGVFGGLYLPHLRNAVYNSLLKAENIYNESLLKGEKWKSIDFDCDSADEFLYESKSQNIYVSPDKGGSIFEWDIFKINHNLLNVLTRRYECYHKKIKDNVNNASLVTDKSSEVQTIHSGAIRIKESGIDKFLVYDGYRRVSLADHFFDKNIKCSDCMLNVYEEKGDFIGGKYDAELKGIELVLKRLGKVYEQNVLISKTISPIGDGYKVSYEITNKSRAKIELCFAPEQIFAFSSKKDEDMGDLKGVEIWRREDEYFKIAAEVKFLQKTDLFIYPIETVSNSDNGYEKTYQGTVMVPLVKFQLNPEETKQFFFETTVKYF
jgi:alpha-amylase